MNAVPEVVGPSPKFDGEYAIVEAPRPAGAAVVDRWTKDGFDLVSHAAFVLKVPRKMLAADERGRMVGETEVLCYSFVFRRRRAEAGA